MRIKIDEDVPVYTARWLRDRGYDTQTVYEQEMGGWKDDALWRAVQAEQRFLITADKGFGDIRIYPPGSHGGVLVLRPDEDGIPPILSLLQRVLDEVDLNQFMGSVAVVTPRGIRVRRRST